MVIKSDVHYSFHVQQRPWTPTKRRGPIAAEYGTPGPAAVSLPSTIGVASHDSISKRAKSPAFSFGGRHEEKKDPFVPGPGAYNISGLCHTGKESAAAPTLSGKLKEPEPFKTPAPGAYSPEKAGPVAVGQAPSYSFGLKTKDAKPDQTPAPGAYSPEKAGPVAVTTAPSFSFGLKHKDAKPDDVPAPGTYSPEKSLPVGTPTSPSFSFGLKGKDPKSDLFPAPGAYSPEKFAPTALPHAPAFSFGFKTKDVTPYPTPAPNVYKIPSTVGNERDVFHKHGPSYSMRPKTEDLFNGVGKHSPGPAKYETVTSNAYKSKSPSYTLSYRTTIPGDRTQKPGPGAHSPEKVVFQQTPAYSFGIRHSQHAYGIEKGNKLNCN